MMGLGNDSRAGLLQTSRVPIKGMTRSFIRASIEVFVFASQIFPFLLHSFRPPGKSFTSTNVRSRVSVASRTCPSVCTLSPFLREGIKEGRMTERKEEQKKGGNEVRKERSKKNVKEEGNPGRMEGPGGKTPPKRQSQDTRDITLFRCYVSVALSVTICE